MDTHTLSPATSISDTVQWLRNHGCVSVAGQIPEDAPGLLFRPAATPNEPPKLAVLGDTLIADGRVVTIAGPTLKGLT